MARATARNWDYAGKMFEFAIPENLEESINDAVDQAQGVYTESILEVLSEQPSDWTPKSEGWAKRSGNKDLFYGEQGDFFVAVTSEKNKRGIRAKRGDKRIFVGARHDIGHHSGYSVETLAEILQSIPDGSRDLFGRAYERVEDRIHNIFRNVGIEIR
jgi:hypothetical protein